jgi:calcineurin-like phosphoesterase family protein
VGLVGLEAVPHHRQARNRRPLAPEWFSYVPVADLQSPDAGRKKTAPKEFRELIFRMVVENPTCRTYSFFAPRLREGTPMPNVWFTADFHLGHKNIIRYCSRAFDTVEEMNRTIIERLNSVVKTNDILYFLGDFCIGPKARAVELRREIRCKKIFAVPGNHDKDTRKLTQEFSWLGDLAEVSINGQRIVLCHYAMRVWNHSSHGAWHLYGHSHGRLPSLDASLSMDVGVDTRDFRPWHFDEIQDRMKQRGASTPR